MSFFCKCRVVVKGEKGTGAEEAAFLYEGVQLFPDGKFFRFAVEEEKDIFHG
jgi:hypothetical protein